MKELAWKWLRSSGNAGDGELLSDCLHHEPNDFVNSRTLDQLRFVAFDTLPSQVAELITERYDCNGDDETLGLRISAIEFARALATEDCFKVLLNFGLTHEDQVLRTSAYSLADVLIWHIKCGDETSLQATFEAARNSSLRHQQEAAVTAISRAASEGVLHPNLRICISKSRVATASRTT